MFIYKQHRQETFHLGLREPTNENNTKKIAPADHMKLSILIVVHNGSVISIKPAHDYWKNSIYYILFVCANDECECAYAHWYCWLALCYTRVTIKSIRCRIGWWMNWKTCRVRQMQELICYYTRDNRHTQYTNTCTNKGYLGLFFWAPRFCLLLDCWVALLSSAHSRRLSTDRCGYYFNSNSYLKTESLINEPIYLASGEN